MSRSTMNDLFHRAAEKLAPLDEPLFSAIRRDFLVMADETSFKLSTQSSKAYVWAFLGSKLTGYRFACTRGGDTAVDALGNSKGVLVCDDYRGYDRLFAKGKRRRCGCLAHARRKFFDAGDIPEVREALDLIAFIYAVEHEAARRKVLGTREHHELRRTFSRPAFTALMLLARRIRRTEGPKTLLGIAARYALNNLRPLRAFLDDARIPPDNNRSENALRIVALGRKNFLFVHSEQAGKNVALLYSLVGSCVRLGVNPIDYLTDVLDRIDSVPNNKRRDLLPDRWRPPTTAGPVAEFDAT